MILLSSCSLKPERINSGTNALNILNFDIKEGITKRSDIIELLGPPSTYSLGDIDTLIYIERSTSSSKLTKLGGKKLLTNNVLVVEINNRGLAINKSFLDKEDMNNIYLLNELGQISQTNTLDRIHYYIKRLIKGTEPRNEKVMMFRKQKTK